MNEYLNKSQGEMVEELDLIFENLKKAVSHKIDEIKKNCKVKVLETWNRMKNSQSEFI